MAMSNSRIMQKLTVRVIEIVSLRKRRRRKQIKKVMLLLQDMKIFASEYENYQNYLDTLSDEDLANNAQLTKLELETNFIANNFTKETRKDTFIVNDVWEMLSAFPNLDALKTSVVQSLLKKRRSKQIERVMSLLKDMKIFASAHENYPTHLATYSNENLEINARLPKLQSQVNFILNNFISKGFTITDGVWESLRLLPNLHALQAKVEQNLQQLAELRQMIEKQRIEEQRTAARLAIHGRSSASYSSGSSDSAMLG